MPWDPEQWRAIAANTMHRLGPVEGRKKLHQYKVEAGGHATTGASRLAAKLAKRKLGR